MSTFIATQRAVGQRERDRWTQDTELAAQQVEVTHSLLRAFVQANSKKGSKPMEPLRIPRPHDDDQKPVKMTGHEAAAWMAGGSL